MPRDYAYKMPNNIPDKSFKKSRAKKTNFKHQSVDRFEVLRSQMSLKVFSLPITEEGFFNTSARNFFFAKMHKGCIVVGHDSFRKVFIRTPFECQILTYYLRI